MKLRAGQEFATDVPVVHSLDSVIKNGQYKLELEQKMFCQNSPCKTIFKYINFNLFTTGPDWR